MPSFPSNVTREHACSRAAYRRRVFSLLAAHGSCNRAARRAAGVRGVAAAAAGAAARGGRWIGAPPRGWTAARARVLRGALQLCAAPGGALLLVRAKTIPARSIDQPARTVWPGSTKSPDKRRRAPVPARSRTFSDAPRGPGRLPSAPRCPVVVVSQVADVIRGGAGGVAEPVPRRGVEPHARRDPRVARCAYAQGDCRPARVRTRGVCFVGGRAAAMVWSRVARRPRPLACGRRAHPCKVALAPPAPRRHTGTQFVRIWLTPVRHLSQAFSRRLVLFVCTTERTAIFTAWGVCF